MPASVVQTFRAFAYNNAWANYRLLAAYSKLSQEDFEAERTGFFPSLQLTLSHIYVIDLFYIDALEGGRLGPNVWENEVPFPSVAELQRAQAAVDKRLIAICDALTPDLLDAIVRVNRDTQTGRAARPSPDAPLSAPNPPSRTGTRHALWDSRQTTSTRRVLFDRRIA